jgi:4-hydroxybenzoate polyprenyltransferase
MLVERMDTFGTEVRRVFIHARWPVQSYVILGFLFGAIVTKTPVSLQMVVATLAWLLLVAGLTVFNSYYDKDDVEVGGMKSPPKITASLLYGSLTMIAAGLGLSIFIGLPFFICAFLTGFIYFFYSYEGTRWKSNGYAAVSINAIVGALTVLAAASLGSSLLAPVVIYSAITAAFFKASVYTMMQVHQIEEDKKRGDPSMAVMHGRQFTLRFSQITMLLGGIFAIVAVYLMMGEMLLPILTAIYFLVGAVLFEVWIRQPADPSHDAERMQRMIYFTGYAGSVTFFLIYLWLNFQGVI